MGWNGKQIVPGALSGAVKPSVTLADRALTAINGGLGAAFLAKRK
jgi:hypothetical protein